jgi:DNA-binding winged helix-turn-helix (wHTH) protein/cob(I)alamin adenosyltransferase
VPPGASYTFGPFRFDAGVCRLSRDGQPLALPDRHAAILLRLVTQAGKIVPKETLIDVAWKDVAVGDNSLEQAISSLRRALGPAPDGAPYIETLARRGYRFRAPVARVTSRIEGAALDALLAPHRAFVEGRTALETFDRDAVNRAQAVFERIVAGSPDYAPGHIGLANAYSLKFESTRAEDEPDRDALAKAVHHAREACSLDPSSGEAWATLGAVSSQARMIAEGIAAARRSISLENENWRHHLRLAYVSWGEERLRAAQRALKLLPGFAFAHWLSATVHVARGALEEAERQLVAGTVAQDRQQESSRFGTSGLHFLLGLVRLTRGDETAALEEFDRELAFEHAAHIYTREVCAHTWCAVAAVRLRQSDSGAARAALERALASVPGYPLALAGLVVAGDRPPSTARLTLDGRLGHLRMQGALVEAAIGEAVGEALAGRHAAGAALVRTALETAPIGSSGWMLPVEPFLQVSVHPAEWAPVLSILRSRAA